MWTEIMSYIYWSSNQISMSTACSKKYNRVKAPEHHCVTVAKHNSNAWLCLYLSYSSVQQPDSQVNNCSMCRPWTWTTAFNRGRHWSTALLKSCWSRLVQQVHTQSLRSSKPTIHRTELRDIPANFSISLGLCWTQGCLSDCISVQLHARHSVTFWQSSAVCYRLSERSSLLCQSCGEDL